MYSTWASRESNRGLIACGLPLLTCIILHHGPDNLCWWRNDHKWLLSKKRLITLFQILDILANFYFFFNLALLGVHPSGIFRNCTLRWLIRQIQEKLFRSQWFDYHVILGVSSSLYKPYKLLIWDYESLIFVCFPVIPLKPVRFGLIIKIITC